MDLQRSPAAAKVVITPGSLATVREVVPDWAYVVFWILGSLLAFLLVLTVFQGFNSSRAARTLLQASVGTAPPQ